jgi:DNA-binding MarR family transcriptional regulator/N-acetylglutamate synthase-like GNAT family acetyltransferase
MPDAVEEIRSFNRFYTSRLGVLGPGFLRTGHTLGEARVLYELGRAGALGVGELRARMAIDAGQLSRLLVRLERRGLVAREVSPADGRRRTAALTAAGQRDYALLDERSRDETAERLGALDPPERERLVAALAEVRGLLGDGGPTPVVALREPRPGDLGWIIARHGELYVREYGWDGTFEVLVAGIVARYAEAADPGAAAWIADVDGVPAGCVLCVPGEREGVAKLRLLLVEPRARGLGLGTRLVDAVIAFARGAGYRELTLWTNSILTAARRIYERAGFELVDEAPHHSFGRDLVGQNWSRPL